MSKDTFKCPVCGDKISFSELFIFNKNHVTVCENCHTELTPMNGKTFQWGFAFGFLGFVIPAELCKYLKIPSMLSFLAGIIGAVIIIGIVSLYIYKKTIFTTKN